MRAVPRGCGHTESLAKGLHKRSEFEAWQACTCPPGRADIIVCERSRGLWSLVQAAGAPGAFRSPGVTSVSREIFASIRRRSGIWGWWESGEPLINIPLLERSSLAP